jgi:hypothetical protein
MTNHLVAATGGWGTSSHDGTAYGVCVAVSGTNNTTATASAVMQASPYLLPMLLQSPTGSTAGFATCAAHRPDTLANLLEQVAAAAPRMCMVGSASSELRLLLQQVAAAEAAVGPVCAFDGEAAFSTMLKGVAAAEADVGPVCTHYTDETAAFNSMLQAVAAAEAAWVAPTAYTARSCVVCEVLRHPISSLQAYLTPERLSSALVSAHSVTDTVSIIGQLQHISTSYIRLAIANCQRLSGSKFATCSRS